MPRKGAKPTKPELKDLPAAPLSQGEASGVQGGKKDRDVEDKMMNFEIQGLMSDYKR